jgi:tetratricopeptide (TPR) repeat protein
VWQALRNELHPKGFELVTVGLDTLGAAGCRPFIEAAHPEHPSLIDAHHVLAELFGVINIPQSVWIDEAGMIVRPAETAPAPPGQQRARALDPNQELPQRFREILSEAGKIRQDAQAYHQALRDWVDNGANSRYALAPEDVISRSRPRDADVARGHAHFELASELERRGHHDAAVRHFREAHALVPQSWTFRRQAWSLERSVDGPLARYWQGPSPDAPERWPYEGDWLSDIRKSGAENYNEPWKP